MYGMDRDRLLLLINQIPNTGATANLVLQVLHIAKFPGRLQVVAPFWISCCVQGSGS